MASGQTVMISQFVPYVTSKLDACERHEDCALQREHPGDCYAIGELHEPQLRAQLRLARVTEGK